MSNWLIVAIVIGPAIAVGTYGVIAVRRRQRVLAYRGWATDNGLTYTRRDDRWVRAYDWGRPFGVGSGRRAIDVIAGGWRGRPAVVFTYRYTTRSNGPGDSTSTDYHYSALYTITLRRPLPDPPGPALRPVHAAGPGIRVAGCRRAEDVSVCVRGPV